MEMPKESDITMPVQTPRSYKVKNADRARKYRNPEGGMSWSLKPADERVRALRDGVVVKVDQAYIRSTRNTIILMHANQDGSCDFSRYRCFVENTALFNVGEQVRANDEIAYTSSYSPVFLDVFIAADFRNESTWRFIGPGIINLEELV